MRLIAALTGCDTSTVSRFLSSITSHFAKTFSDLIAMPPIATLQRRFLLGDKIIGVLDGTDFQVGHSFGCGVNARDFYRGDKKHYFHLALILSDGNLHIIWAALGIPGHCNDQGAFKKTSLLAWLASHAHAVGVVTDGGFTHADFVRPVVAPHDAAGIVFNEAVRLERSSAEHVNGRLKVWKILDTTFHGAHSLHTLVTFSVCLIHNPQLATI